MITSNDIKLCYFGGSGGHFLLHLLLLSDNFFCRFKKDLTINQILDYQWNITDPTKWKSTEIWPANKLTKELETEKRKLYLFCNPSLPETSEYTGNTVLLYLDKASHIEMMRYKQANYFYVTQTFMEYYRTELSIWRQHYDNLKDPSWPNCTGPNGFKNLPQCIKDELLQNPYTFKYLNFDKWPPRDPNKVSDEIDCLLSRKGPVMNDGTEVLPEVYDFSKFCDICINLRDVVNNPNQLSYITGNNINKKQLRLLNHWVSLHPSSLLKKIGINI